MICKIKAPFRDKNNFAIAYSVGEVVEFSDERASELIGKGFVEAIVEAKAEANAEAADSEQPEEEVRGKSEADAEAEKPKKSRKNAKDA
jgi:hypothetical protein